MFACVNMAARRKMAAIRNEKAGIWSKYENDLFYEGRRSASILNRTGFREASMKVSNRPE